MIHKMEVEKTGRPAVAVELAIYRLFHRTYFEIRGLCEVQNRGSRPWLEPVLTAACPFFLPEAAYLISALNFIKTNCKNRTLWLIVQNFN